MLKDPNSRVSGKQPLFGDKIPDVLYSVQWCNSTGKVLERRESDKPIDAATSGAEPDKVDIGKKPVIEIAKRVSTTHRRPGVPARVPGPQLVLEDDSYAFRTNADGNGAGAELVRTEKTLMLIHSKHLKAALAAIVGYYPSAPDFTSDEPTVIEAPYQVLVHHCKALEHHRTNQPTSHSAEYAAIVVKHIDLLLAFLKGVLAGQIEAEASRWNDPLGVPTATFNLFWLFLKPGEIAYKVQDGQLVPFVISGVGRTGTDDGGPGAYLVNLWNIVFVGGRLQRRIQTSYVYPWNGARAIKTLPLVPAQFVAGGAKKVAEEQLKLGKLYWDLTKRPSYKEYDGPLINRDGSLGGSMTGRVVVDPEGWERFGDGAHGKQVPQSLEPRLTSSAPRKDSLPETLPRCGCKACRGAGIPQGPSPFAGFDNLDPKKDNPPENEDLFFRVLNKTIPAFILGERRWALVYVEFLRDVTPDKDAFKNLVLDSEIKLTVKALTGKFASLDGRVSPWPSDFVKNKGEGRIFLLHGSPGVGKTCTAECVAELTHRPLLALTSGDISTSMSVASVERSLNYFLALGERFGALVLLDEADVYLEQRRASDLRRNGLVSIFLRALEYYRGLLFLTTNRVEAFDSAFTSRIHVALHYRNLTDDDRQRIWINNFDRLERDSAGKCTVLPAARKFALASAEVRALRWNGREIRNALQTAVALAETEALDSGGLDDTVALADSHLTAVTRMSGGFKAFLRRQQRTAAAAVSPGRAGPGRELFLKEGDDGESGDGGEEHDSGDEDDEDESDGERQ